jgi:hypothetical protein
VERERLVTLIGPSGGGKSSLSGAGLLPVLADRGGWRFIRICPGDDPFDALAGALLAPGLTTGQRVEERRRLNALLIEGPAGFMAVLREWSSDAPGTRLLLVVDQFEELFTNAQAGDPGRARAFAVALGTLAAADPAAEVSVRLLLALRADFMGRAMDGPTAPFIAPERQCQVGPLDTEDLKAAILGPAAACGVRFGPGLVDAMVADLEDQPGRLPLLQFALTQLWDQQQARCIDAAALERLGGVRRALSAYADGVIDALSEADRTRARRILIQLVRPAERAEDVGTRQVASLRRIADQDQDLLPRLVASRLVVTSGGTDDEPLAEIAHEALIREWDRLRTWVGEDRVFRLWQEGLRSRLADWETHGRHPGYLLAGAPLAEAEGRLAVYPQGLSQADGGYIRASRQHAERGRRRGRAGGGRRRYSRSRRRRGRRRVAMATGRGRGAARRDGPQFC